MQSWEFRARLDVTAAIIIWRPFIELHYLGLYEFLLDAILLCKVRSPSVAATYWPYHSPYYVAANIDSFLSSENF